VNHVTLTSHIILSYLIKTRKEQKLKTKGSMTKTRRTSISKLKSSCRRQLFKFKTTEDSCNDDTDTNTKEQTNLAQHTNMYAEEQTSSHPKGISVHCLRHTLLREVTEAGLGEESTIYQLENLRKNTFGVIRRKGAANKCPRDGGMGAAYVDCLEGEDNVGPANRMLSYLWGYTIGDIIDCLEEYCVNNRMDPTRTYIWICCLCNNQHRVGENIPFDNFHTIFRDTVLNVGHVLALMAPRDSFHYLNRVWCIFELFTADAIDDCKVEIIMPPRQKEEMLKDLRYYDNLVGVLVATDIENAEASKEEDKIKIMELVKRDTGVAVLNKHVNDLLRTCIRRVILTAVDDFGAQSDDRSMDLEFANLCFDAGQLMQEHKRYDDALILYNKALVVRENALGEDHLDTALTCNSIVEVGRGFEEALVIRQKDLQVKVRLLRKALVTRENVLGEEHSLTLTTRHEIARAENNLAKLVII